MDRQQDDFLVEGARAAGSDALYRQNERFVGVMIGLSFCWRC